MRYCKYSPLVTNADMTDNYSWGYGFLVVSDTPIPQGKRVDESVYIKETDPRFNYYVIEIYADNYASNEMFVRFWKEHRLSEVWEYMQKYLIRCYRETES